MPTSARRYKSFLRKSSANSFAPLGRCGHRPLRNTWRIHRQTRALFPPTPNVSSRKLLNKKRGRLCTTSLSFSYRANLLSFNRNDFTTIVIAASLADSVRQAGLAALRASNNARDRQFPVGAASLISSRAGYFSLGYCHLVHLLG